MTSDRPTMDPNVKRALWRLGTIVVVLILGGVGSNLSHSAGPMIAALFFSVIMGLFALFASTGNHQASWGLMTGLGAFVAASEIHQAIERHEESKQQSG